MKTFYLMFLLLPITVQAQDEFEPVTKSQFTADLGFSGLQLGAELKTAKTHTIQFRTGLMPMLYYDIYDMKGIQLANSISASVEYRIYYNFLKRLEKDKDIRNNGANYFGFLFMYISEPVTGEPSQQVLWPSLMTGPVWGFNRPLGERFNFNFTLGPVLQKFRNSGYYENQNDITLYLDLRWSYIFR
ncbi:MAG TPA: hypothetical protein VGC29_03210 [Flavisolibacter sp.]